VAVHICTQTIHRTTQITTEQHTKQLMWRSAGRALTPAFALQLRKKHGKTSEGNMLKLIAILVQF